MKALLVTSVFALPLLLTSCYVDGVAYDGGGYRHRDWDRHHHHTDVIIDRRPVVIHGKHNDWDHGHKYVSPYPYNKHGNVTVKKVEVKHVDKYEGYKKKKRLL
ncbi:MAG TPA: hypothetical protein VHM91_03375 [Verrucomicrobiales bacterium]|jgi:hypothetical protein|nr:hypothetical protein [Verrucomicrobiales bacterium]